MSGSPINSISAFEPREGADEVAISIRLVDGRHASVLTSREVMCELARWLNTHLDRSTESFRPFLSPVLGWVWDKYFPKEVVEDEFEYPF